MAKPKARARTRANPLNPDEDVRTESTNLTLREALFCKYYVGEAASNGTEAMILAGYAGGKAGASARASSLLKDPRIKLRIRTLIEDKMARVDLSVEKVLREMMTIAFERPPTIIDFMDENGAIKPIEQWTPAMGAEVRELKVEELWTGTGQNRVRMGVTKELKLHPHKPHKDKNLEMLAKYLKMLSNSLELTGKDGKDLFSINQETEDERARNTRQQLLAELGPMAIEGGPDVH